MNERFVAVSTITGCSICGCFSKPRCDFSVTRGWQQMMNAIRWIKQFAEKNHINELTMTDMMRGLILFCVWS